MSTPVKVGAFLVALVAVFAAAFGIGRATGPEVAGGDEHGHDSGRTVLTPASGDHDDHGDETDGHAHGDEAAAGGLASSEGGHTLVLDRPQLPAGTRTLSFSIRDDAGEAVTEYDVVHEKELHLIVVRRDLGGFQHVHPERADDGTWTTPVDLTPGAWRVFADFAPADGEPLTLGADLAVPGVVPAAPQRPVDRTDTVDGYDVHLAGDLLTGDGGTLTLHVTRDGEPVTDVQPYLGARGHLVALREGDLAYLHVHPEEADPQEAHGVSFHAAAPSAGRYQLYFDFKHDGVVRTASFTLATGASEGAPEGGAEEDHHDDGDHQH